MAIQVGDAELVFLANTQQLDQALDKLPEKVRNKTKPAANAIGGISEQWQFAGKTASTAGDAAIKVGDRFVEAGRRSRESIHEARGALELFGDQIGVRVPREIRTLIAQIPGVGTALSAAFKITAIAAFAGVIVEAALKLNQLIIDTFIYTEAMKQQDATFGRLNMQLATQADKLRETNKEFNLLGTFGAARTLKVFEEMVNGRGGLKEQDESLRAVQDQLFFAKQGWTTLTDAQRINLETQRDILTTQTKEGWERAAIIQQQYQDQLREENRAFNEARIDGEKSTALATVQLRKQLSLRTAEIFQQTSTEVEAINRRAVDEEYQINRRALLAKLDILREDPTKNKVAIETLHHEIESLEIQHQEKLLEIDAERVKRQVELARNKIPDITASIILPTGIQAGGPLQALLNQSKELQLVLFGPGSVPDGISRISAALSTLGMGNESLFGVQKTLGNQRTAVEELQRAYENHLVSIGDVDRARLSLIETELHAIRVSGLDAKAKELQTKALETERRTILTRLNPALNTWAQVTGTAASAAGHAMINAGYAFGQGATSAVQALRQIAAAAIQSVASIAQTKGDEQIVIALSYWPNFAGMAAHFAAAAAWFTLGGAISALAGAAAGSGSSATNIGEPGFGGTAGSNAPATQAERAPVQGRNVQRFASSALVTSPTLAVVGDSLRGTGSSREGIFNLDDPYAMDTIGQAVAEAMQGRGIGGEHHYHIKGDLVDLNQIGKKISRGVRRGRVRMTSSSAARVTRKG